MFNRKQRKYFYKIEKKLKKHLTIRFFSCIIVNVAAGVAELADAHV